MSELIPKGNKSNLTTSQSAAWHVLAALYFLHQGPDWPKRVVANPVFRLNLDRFQMTLSRHSSNSALPSDLVCFIRDHGERSAAELLWWMVHVIGFAKPIGNDGTICLNHETHNYMHLLTLTGKKTDELAKLGQLIFSGCLERVEPTP